MLVSAFLCACQAGSSRLLLVPADFSTWQRTTAIRLDYPIPGHEDNYRIIHINDAGMDFDRSQQGRRTIFSFPAGTIIAKAIFQGASPAQDAAPVMVTAMIKAPGDRDARGGWLWVVKDLAMGTETIMTGDFCVTCHANANEAHPYGDRNPAEDFRDYVFFVPGYDGRATPENLLYSQPGQ
jgi:hypothetical protein